MSRILRIVLGGWLAWSGLLASAVPAGTAEAGTPATPAPLPDLARPPDPTGVLTLADCLALACANSRALRIADRRVLMARDQVNEVRAVPMPKVSASSQFEHRGNAPGPHGLHGVKDNTVETFGVVVPVYVFGEATNAIRAASLYRRMAELSAERTGQDVRLQVSLAYYRVLESQKIAVVVDESLRVLEEQRRVAADFHAQGMVAKTDVLAVDVQVAQRRQEQVAARNNTQVAVATLNRAVGLDVRAATRLADALEPSPWAGTYEAAVVYALENRPDLALLTHQIGMCRAKYLATRGTLGPQFGLFARYSYAADNSLENQGWATVGGGVTWSLWNGGQTWAELARTRKEIAESVDVRDDRIEGLQLEVRKACLDLQSAAEQIPVARKAVEWAEEDLRMTRDQYREGLVTSADVLAEEQRLAQARSSHYRSLYGYHAAYEQLVNTVGGPPPAAAPAAAPVEVKP